MSGHQSLQSNLQERFSAAFTHAGAAERVAGSPVLPTDVLAVLGSQEDTVAQLCLEGLEVRWPEPARVNDAEGNSGVYREGTSAMGAVFVRALLEAGAARHPWVSTGHLLLALAAEDRACAETVLQAGMSVDLLRDRVDLCMTSILTGHAEATGEGPPRPPRTLPTSGPHTM